MTKKLLVQMRSNNHWSKPSLRPNQTWQQLSTTTQLNKLLPIKPNTLSNNPLSWTKSWSTDSQCWSCSSSPCLWILSSINKKISVRSCTAKTSIQFSANGYRPALARADVTDECATPTNTMAIKMTRMKGEMPASIARPNSQAKRARENRWSSAVLFWPSWF